MRSRVYETVRCLSVRPSVCLSVPARVTAANFAAVGPAGRKYRSIAARRTAARRAAGECGYSAMLSAYVVAEGRDGSRGGGD